MDSSGNINSEFNQAAVNARQFANQDCASMYAAAVQEQRILDIFPLESDSDEDYNAVMANARLTMPQGIKKELFALARRNYPGIGINDESMKTFFELNNASPAVEFDAERKNAILLFPNKLTEGFTAVMMPVSKIAALLQEKAAMNFMALTAYLEDQQVALEGKTAQLMLDQRDVLVKTMATFETLTGIKVHDYMNAAALDIYQNNTEALKDQCTFYPETGPVRSGDAFKELLITTLADASIENTSNPKQVKFMDATRDINTNARLLYGLSAHLKN